MQQFVIEQKVTAFANQYRIYRADESGEKGEQVGFAHQKRFAFKEKFDVYTDESKSTVLFSAQARQVIDLGARYDVTDANGRLLGVLGKDFKSSLARSTWQIFDIKEDAPLAIARERSKAVAFWRRLWAWLPEVGEWPFPIRYHFDFIRPEDEQTIGSLEKTKLLYDHYLLKADDSLLKQSDWRVLVALGIMLDALQSR